MRLIYFFEVMADGRHANAKEVCHLFLGQPKGLALEQHLNAHSSIGRGIQDDLVVQWSLPVLCHFAPTLHYPIYKKPTGILPLTGVNPATTGVCSVR
jgi:hypothetical protein